MKGLPEFFSAEGLHAEQFFAVSADGTKVPYFLVSKKAMALDGSTPTLLYGYGGFEVTMTPFYNTGVGIQWLEKGYAYAVANIRRRRRVRAQVASGRAEALAQQGVRGLRGGRQAPRRARRHDAAEVGIKGGSNGGLLTGNMLARSPELFGAIVCQVPLLDMRRFHKLLAGASWMGEYGDPEEEWDAFLSRYSPYHLVDEATTYPPILFTTSTRDDRVHPGRTRARWCASCSTSARARPPTTTRTSRAATAARPPQAARGDDARLHVSGEDARRRRRRAGGRAALRGAGDVWWDILRRVLQYRRLQAHGEARRGSSQRD